MAEETVDEAKETAIMEPVGRLTFLQDPKKHGLARVLKKIDKASDEALDFLSECMKDTALDKKERIACAKFLVERKIEVAEAIGKDGFARLIAESRLILASKVKRDSPRDVGDDDSEEGEQEPSGPRYVPGVILDASNLNKM